jgi:PAS domain S-box-containing protein
LNKSANFLSADTLLAAIVDSSDDAIVSKDLHSVITSWNAGAERIFGYTPEEMIGQPIDRLFPKDRLEEEARILGRIQRGERVEHFETVRLHKNGTPIDVSLTISPIRNSEGVVVGASKIARNITEAKTSARKLAEAHDALKRADRLKAEFLATLSHELRTPLNAILGWITILKDGPNAEELEQGLDVIERNVRVQSQLIEDLLDMSRIEAGKVSLDIQPVDLAAVAMAAIETVRPAADAKGIRLSSVFASVGGAVMGDKNRLQQIVWNLLTNAVKFTPKLGHVHVVIERVNSHVEISVTDSGGGIAPEFLGQVFDRFRQADASTTRRHGGLGLGLSIVKNLVEMHGGTVRVASQGLGFGAVFTVNLPLVAIQQNTQLITGALRDTTADESFAATDLQGVKVLVVDDEADSSGIVKRILQRSGAEVSTAGSMQEALAEFERFGPHVVLSDIGMPEHDGYEFMARLRELPGARAVPAVALTALARAEDRTRALRAGFQLHVAKPVDATELVAVVQNLAALKSQQQN